MCGDLVSNHGTTGRASIERAEARPSYPILSFAWSHVGAGANQPNPTQPDGLSLLRLHLRVSTNRPPSFSFSSSPSSSYFSSSPLPPSACHPLLPTAVLFLLLLLLLLLLLIHLLLLLVLLLPPSFASQTNPATTFSTSADTLTRTRNFRRLSSSPLPRSPPFERSPIHFARSIPQPRPIPRRKKS